ncbi:MAG: DUF1295 domain-containing protein [Draconibacterium sp.]|nr:DUF1295 domain-containing protein [Draconibacterium sp.]
MRFFDFFPLLSFLIIGLMITGRIILLKMKNVQIIPKVKKNKLLKYFLYSFFLLILILLIFELTITAFQISHTNLPCFISNNFVDSLFLKVVGTLLILTSLVFMGFTLQNFNKSLRFGMDPNNLGKLITTGIFSVSRNPFFVSIEIYFIGIAFLITNLFFIAIALSTIINIHLFILKEEKFMQQNYGEEYEKFNRKVRRYF